MATMLRYAVRAVPWARVLVAGALVVALLEVVRLRPGSTWALLGAAVGVLAGAAAWSFDEPAATVVDPSPRSLAWRTAARLPSPAALLALWFLGLARAQDDLLGHAVDLGVAGASGVLAGVAWTVWRRSAGEATPGTRFAFVVVPAATAWALGQPLGRHLPVFPSPFADPAHWSASRTGWIAAGCAAAALLAAATAEVRWWAVERRSSQVPWGPRPR